MIFVVTTTEERIEEDLSLIIEGYSKKRKLLLKGKEVKEEIVKIASSLFQDKNLLIVIINPEIKTLKEVKDKLSFLKDLITIVIYFTVPPEESLSFLDAAFISMDKERRFEERVRSILRAYGKKMTKKAFDLLKTSIEEGGFIESEMMKLINFIGEKEVIDSKDVNTIVSKEGSKTLLDFFEALLGRDKRKCLELLDHFIKSGMDMQILQSYLLRQVRLFLQAKDRMLFERSDYAEFQKNFKKWKDLLPLKPERVKEYLAYQKPFYAYKILKLSERFSFESLESLHESLFLWEIKRKRGSRTEKIFIEERLLRV